LRISRTPSSLSLCRDLYNEALIKMGDATNLSSVLRVSCINCVHQQQSLAPENAINSLRH
jgi:predicted DNA-binding ribbon-helix-helix protein